MALSDIKYIEANGCLDWIEHCSTTSSYIQCAKSLRKKMANQEELNFKCSFCEKKGFKSVHALNGHTKIHRDRRLKTNRKQTFGKKKKKYMIIHSTNNVVHWMYIVHE